MTERQDIDVWSIATALTFVMPGWRAEYPKPDGEHLNRGSCTLVRIADDLRLHVYGDRWEQKLSISGEFPHHYAPHDIYGREDPAKPETRIACSPTKAPDKIAADITRRLLPGVLVALEKARTLKARDDAQKATARRHAVRLAKSLGLKDPTTEPEHRQPRADDRTNDWSLWVEGGKFKISSYKPQLVEVERLTLDIETAVALATLVRKRRRQLAAARSND